MCEEAARIAVSTATFTANLTCSLVSFDIPRGIPLRTKGAFDLRGATWVLLTCLLVSSHILGENFLWTEGAFDLQWRWVLLTSLLVSSDIPGANFRWTEGAFHLLGWHWVLLTFSLVLFDMLRESFLLTKGAFDLPGRMWHFTVDSGHMMLMGLTWKQWRRRRVRIVLEKERNGKGGKWKLSA